MSGILGPNRRNVVALAVVCVLLAITYVFVPDPLVRYGVWLVVFTVWMVWFVLAAVEWISKADF